MSQVSVILWSWLQHVTVQTLSLHLSFSEPNWMTPGVFLLLFFQMVLFGRKKCRRWPMRNDLVGVIVCDVDGLSLSSTHFAFSRGQPSRAIRFQELSWERNVWREPVLAASACSKAKTTLSSGKSHPQAGFGCAFSWRPGPGIRGTHGDGLPLRGRPCRRGGLGSWDAIQVSFLTGTACSDCGWNLFWGHGGSCILAVKSCLFSSSSGF